MQTIIGFPENKEHLTALKAFLKALKTLLCEGSTS
jgi:hypothetical protein